DLLADVHGLVVLADHGGYEERVTTADLLLLHLKLSADRIRPSTGKQLKHIMVQLGWDHRRRSRSTATRSRATAGSLKDLHLATRTPSRGILRYLLAIMPSGRAIIVFAICGIMIFAAYS